MDEAAAPSGPTERRSFATCFDDDAQDVAFVLITLGWVVLPHGPDMALWRIGDLIFTDEELLGFAARQGVRPPPERLQ